MLFALVSMLAAVSANLFPVGDFEKGGVLRLAERAGLPRRVLRQLLHAVAESSEDGRLRAKGRRGGSNLQGSPRADASSQDL